MSKSITIGGNKFDVAAVAFNMVAAVLTDPTMPRLIWRNVYHWDAGQQAGKFETKVTAASAAALPNGLVFFVPKVQANGILGLNLAASERLRQRFLDHVGAETVDDLTKAITTLVQLPQKILPLADYSDLNPYASYRIKMHTAHSVLQLRDQAQDLTVYLCLPETVSFHHEITAVKDPAGYEALIAKMPDLRERQLSYPVPSKSKPNAGLRQLAIAKRIEEETANLARVTSDTPAAVIDAFRAKIEKLKTDWDGLKSV